MVTILSINIQDRPDRVAAEAEDEHMPYPVLLGRRTGIAGKYKIRRLPHLIIIDREGKIHTSKTFLKFEDIKEILDTLLKK